MMQFHSFSDYEDDDLDNQEPPKPPGPNHENDDSDYDDPPKPTAQSCNYELLQRTMYINHLKQATKVLSLTILIGFASIF